jgi:hypothetical protein
MHCGSRFFCVRTTCRGGFCISRPEGIQLCDLRKILWYSVPIVKGGPRFSRPSSVIRAPVNECGPTGLAEALNPQAAMSSVTPRPTSVLAVPEAQQSRSRRISDSASSRACWIPLHLTVLKLGSRALGRLRFVS